MNGFVDAHDIKPIWEEKDENRHTHTHAHPTIAHIHRNTQRVIRNKHKPAIIHIKNHPWKYFKHRLFYSIDRCVCVCVCAFRTDFHGLMIANAHITISPPKRDSYDVFAYRRVSATNIPMPMYECAQMSAYTRVCRCVHWIRLCVVCWASSTSVLPKW